MYKVDLAERRKANPDIISILLGHITVSGSQTSTGQTLVGGDVCISLDSLTEVGADYVGLGHIHKPQEFEPNIHYAGSCFPVNWGEVEQKSMIWAELEGNGKSSFERIPFDFPPMVDLELTYSPETGLPKVD